MQIKHTHLFSINRRETVRPCKTVEWNSATACNISVQLVSLKIRYLAEQPTQSADMLSKAQAIHPFKFWRAYIVKNESFHMHLKSHKIYGLQRKAAQKVCQSEKIFNQHSSSLDI